MPQSLHEEAQKIDKLIAKGRKLPMDDYAESVWAKYLTVATSGYLENALGIIFYNYTQKRANRAVLDYVEEQLASMPLPWPTRILKLVNSFNSDVGQQLEIYWQGSKRGAISSIMRNRNKIAHGDDAPQVTMSRIIDYYIDAKSVIRFLDEKINGV